MFGLRSEKSDPSLTISRGGTAIILISIKKLPELAPMVNPQVKIIHMKHKPLPSNTGHPLGNFCIMQNHPIQPTGIFPNPVRVRAIRSTPSAILQTPSSWSSCGSYGRRGRKTERVSWWPSEVLNLKSGWEFEAFMVDRRHTRQKQLQEIKFDASTAHVMRSTSHRLFPYLLTTSECSEQRFGRCKTGFPGVLGWHASETSIGPGFKSTF